MTEPVPTWDVGRRFTVLSTRHSEGTAMVWVEPRCANMNGKTGHRCGKLLCISVDGAATFVCPRCGNAVYVGL